MFVSLNFDNILNFLNLISFCSSDGKTACKLFTTSLIILDQTDRVKNQFSFDWHLIGRRHLVSFGVENNVIFRLFSNQFFHQTFKIKFLGSREAVAVPSKFGCTVYPRGEL